MKPFFASAIAALVLSGPAYAGGLAPTVTNDIVVVTEDTGGSLGQLVVPLLLVALIAVAESSGGTSAEPVLED